MNKRFESPYFIFLENLSVLVRIKKIPLSAISKEDDLWVELKIDSGCNEYGRVRLYIPAILEFARKYIEQKRKEKQKKKENEMQNIVEEYIAKKVNNAKVIKLKKEWCFDQDVHVLDKGDIVGIFCEKGGSAALELDNGWIIEFSSRENFDITLKKSKSVKE